MAIPPRVPARGRGARRHPFTDRAGHARDEALARHPPEGLSILRPERQSSGKDALRSEARPHSWTLSFPSGACASRWRNLGIWDRLGLEPLSVLPAKILTCRVGSA